MNQVSLARRLTLFLTATIITVSLVAATVIAYFATQQSNREISNKAQATLDYLAGSLAVPIWNLNEDIVKNIGDTVAQDTTISQIEILDISRDRVLYSFNRKHDSGLLQASRTIAHEGYSVGEVRIALSTHSFDERLTELLRSLLATIAIIVASIALVMRSLISTYLKHPFAELTKLTNAYGEGNYEPTAEVKYLEFQPFTTVLESMGRKILEQLQMLRAINLDLENRVKERTSDLEAAKDAAEVASQVKSDFLANMSHEIRTPMNAIIGMTHLALDTGLNTRQRDYLQNIQKSAQHLLGLINDVLDFSKIEAGQAVLDPVPFELNRLLDDVAALHADKAACKQLVLSFAVEPDVPQCLLGDVTKLRQILLNLVSNAIKFTDRGEIAVEVRAEPRETGGVLLRFTVRDTGIGLTKEQIGRLFQSFQQADSSTTRKYGGTGLGLAISKRLTEMLGGEIEVTSEPGHGSTFWFTAALERNMTAGQTSEATTSVISQATDQERLASIAGAHVVLADDNPLNQEILRFLIEQAGLIVHIACDGDEALKYLEEVTPNACDLVLMDMQMPVMDGLMACMAIRELPGGADLPIVGITANAASAEREAGLRAGMNDVIDKPITATALWSTLLRWVEPRSAMPGMSGQSALSSPNIDGQELRRVCKELAQQLAGNELRSMHTFKSHAGLLQVAAPRAAKEIEAALADIDFERALAALTAMTRLLDMDSFVEMH